MAKDSKYFQSTKKGEIPELQADLNSLKEDKKKEAVKKVIALMTVGKDVSMLFADVVKCITTTNLELKKLVYLYVMNYAASNSDDAILAVNTFHQDCSDTNPLIRALAIRTMGCLRVEKIVEYLCEPLRNCLQDPDPYVAKTAAICVAKLYDINPKLVETQGFITLLRELIASNNPTVVSNAVAALSEIDEVSPEHVFVINRNDINRLLVALEECTEWGQVFLLTSLVKYNVKDDDEALKLVEKVTPRLQHANTAVVLATIKVLIKHLDRLDREKQKEITKKMRPSLVTMLSKEPEIQYVALRNINLILQKRPNLLNEIKFFFCQYSDPLYVKMEKLEIMIMLISEKNVDQALVELKEYCNRADVEFVRKSVRAIGRAAVKLGKSAEKCVQLLLELIKSTKLRHVIQEAVVVVKDVLRRYGHEYDHVIETLLDEGLVEQLNEPDAKASIVWIIGEFSDKIKNVHELIDGFLAGIKDESSNVQLQLLTTVVKLFLKDPANFERTVTDTLSVGMNEIENPDTRDRAFLYWRLLALNPTAAKSVVCSMKPIISDESEHLDPQVLNELLSNISTLASVYHKPPSTFVKALKVKMHQTEEEDKEGRNGESLLPSVDETLPTHSREPVLFTPQNGTGLHISGRFIPKGETLHLKLIFNNSTSQIATDFQLKFKPNIYHIGSPTLPSIQVPAGQSATVNVQCPISQNPPNPLPPASTDIQAALKTSLGVSYFSIPISIFNLLSSEGKLEANIWLGLWASINRENYNDLTFGSDLTGGEKPPSIDLLDPFAPTPIAPPVSVNIPKLQSKLESNRIFLVANKNINGQNFLYLSAKTLDGSTFLIEVAVENSKLCIKSASEHLVPSLAFAIQSILS